MDKLNNVNNVANVLNRLFGRISIFQFSFSFGHICARPMIIENELAPSVNFTNVLRTAFTYVSCKRSFLVPMFKVCPLLA